MFHPYQVKEMGEDSQAALFHGIRLGMTLTGKCSMLALPADFYHAALTPCSSHHAFSALLRARVPLQASWRGCRGQPAHSPHLNPTPSAAAGHPEEAFPLLEKGLSVAVDNYNHHVRHCCCGVLGLRRS